MPVATNGIFAETLDLLCGKCFNLSKSVSALQVLAVSALNLCVCMKTCPMVLVAPFEDGSFIFNCVLLMISIEHAFVFINMFSECMFCFRR